MKTRATFIAAIMATTLMALLASAACGGQTVADATPIALERAAPTPAVESPTATPPPTAEPTATPTPPPSVLQDERIAFVSDRDGNSEIYAMNPDGSAATRLTDNDAHDWNPVWSPDGQRIAFISNRDGNLEIYAMNPDGSDATRLTTNNASDMQPAWSPDSQRIAFVIEKYDNLGYSRTSDIYVMNADGSDLIRLVNDDDWQSAPAWSPDGRRIVFVSRDRDGNSEIYAANADGSAITRLTNHDAGDWQPAWSPDGRRIAFISDRDAVYSGVPRDSGIYSMNADGSGLTRLTHNDLADRNPVWSPDGKRIAFVSSPGHAHAWVSVMNADGTSATLHVSGQPRLLPKPRPRPAGAQPGGTSVTPLISGHEFAWSPDGKRIVAVNYPGDGDIVEGDNEIYVATSDGSEIIQLTDNDYYDGAPSWRPAP